MHNMNKRFLSLLLSFSVIATGIGSATAQAEEDTNNNHVIIDRTDGLTWGSSGENLLIADNIIKHGINNQHQVDYCMNKTTRETKDFDFRADPCPSAPIDQRTLDQARIITGLTSPLLGTLNPLAMLYRLLQAALAVFSLAISPSADFNGMYG